MSRICNFPISKSKRCKQPVADGKPDCGRHKIFATHSDATVDIMAQPVFIDEDPPLAKQTDDGRFYALPGTGDYTFPSVTNVVSRMFPGDRDNLERWQARQAVDYVLQQIGNNSTDRAIFADDLMDDVIEWQHRAATRGSKIHKALQAALQPDVERPALSADEDAATQRVLNWLKNDILHVIGCEMTVFKDDPKFAGTLDLMYVDKNKLITLADYKTGRSVHHGKWAAQLSAEKHADLLCVDSKKCVPMPKIDRVLVLQPTEWGKSLKIHDLTECMEQVWDEFKIAAHQVAACRNIMRSITASARVTTA